LKLSDKNKVEDEKKEETPTKQGNGSGGHNIIFCYADSAMEYNTSHWRCKIPSDAMNRAGNGWKGKLIHYSGFLNFLDPAIQDLVGPADLVIFERNVAWQEALDAMEYWQGMGKPVVIALDDAYQSLPWSNPAHNFWHVKDDGEALKFLERGMTLSDGLISPNRFLLKDWEYCTRGYYIQNFAPPDIWTDLPSREESKEKRGLSDKIVIGWGGSVSHYDGWWGSGIREAATKVCARHPEVTWMVCGNDKRLFDQLPVPFDQKVFHPGVPADKWPLNIKAFDIGVAPLFGPYEQRRSWLKGIEYLLAGVPWVGTEGEPYRDIEKLGTLIKNGEESWEEALEAKITNLEVAQEEAEQLIPVARQNFLVDNQLDVFSNVYAQIKQDFVDEKGRLPGIHYVRPKKVEQEEAGAGTSEEPEVS